MISPKSLRSILASALFGLLLTVGCRPVEQDQLGISHSPAAIDQIVKRGEMRVGYLVWEPCVTREPGASTLGGIFPAMVEQIAKNLGVRVVWKETTLANFAAGLGTGQFDFSIGPTFTTIPRAAAVNFTQPVAYVGNSAVVARGSTLGPKSLFDLNLPSITIAILQGQALEEFVRHNLPKAKHLILAGGDLTAPLAAVSSGQAQIGFMNSVTVAQYAAQHPEVRPVFAGSDQVEVLPLSWATRGDDQRTLAFLNSAITYLKSSGRLAEYQSHEPIHLLYDVPKLHGFE
jgi:ABC-type amino acid transport substrate-binding protein